MGASYSKKRADRRRTKSPTNVDPSLSQSYHAHLSPVLYSTPFFLRSHQTRRLKFSRPNVSQKAEEKYWAVDDQSLVCSIQELKQTSLLTFHGPNAAAHNLNRTNSPPVYVQNQARVLIYCNVQTGRYLTSSGDQVVFSADPNQVRSQAEVNALCEFIVHRKRSRSPAPRSSEPLCFGEAVSFECAWHAGLFLAVDGKGQLGISKKPAGFLLATPTLQQLIQLRDNAAAAAAALAAVAAQQAVPSLLPSPKERRDSSDPFAYCTEEERMLAKAQSDKDKNLFALLALLPEELSFKIFFCHADFLKTARLVCKSWRRMAEGKIRTIRVNGEFASLDTVEERAHLIKFAQRCPNLTSLTFRNVIDLEDSEVSELFEGSNLVRVALGGCSRLSDRTTESLAKAQLKHVNLANTAITDKSLCILAERALNLRFLNLYACSGVTSAGVSKCESLAELESINLRGTRIHHRDTVEFTKRRPSTQVLTGPAVAESIFG